MAPRRGYIESLDDLVKLRPCASDLGFWAEVKSERVAAVKSENRKRVLASGCGAVSTFLADPHRWRTRPRGASRPHRTGLRVLFRSCRAWERYNETGGIHAAALTDDERLLFHAEDIGRHNAVDKVVGRGGDRAVPIAGRGLLVTGRNLGRARVQGGARRARLGRHAERTLDAGVTIAQRTGSCWSGGR